MVCVLNIKPGPEEGPSRGLLSDCEIFLNLRFKLYWAASRVKSDIETMTEQYLIDIVSSPTFCALEDFHQDLKRDFLTCRSVYTVLYT